MARYRVKNDSRAEAEKLVRYFVDAVQREPGTYVYEAFKEPDGAAFVHIMSFKDEQAERIHRGASHTKTFVEKLYPLCAEEPVFTELSLIDRAGHAKEDDDGAA